MRYSPTKLNGKRKQRINRLVQLFGLLDHREEVNKVWGWKRVAARFTRWHTRFQIRFDFLHSCGILE